jgi:hypothetical protein
MVKFSFLWSELSDIVDDLPGEAGVAINTWNDYWDEKLGTSTLNNGFDLLLGTIYHRNTESWFSGYCPNHMNFAVAMKGYYLWYPLFPITTDFTWVTLHETLHTYDCIHVSGSGWIMSDNLGGYTLHDQTALKIYFQRGIYDGP